MKWFVAHTKFRCEIKAQNSFSALGVNSYVPVYEGKKEWSDRIKKTRNPAISGYIFFQAEKINYTLVNLNPYLKNVLRRFGKAVEIKSAEIEAMKNCLKNYTEAVSFNTGDSVKIMSGCLKNKEGIIETIEGSFLTLLINSIKVKLSLDHNQLKAVS
jgi:transcription antitermination factor NusG